MSEWDSFAPAVGGQSDWDHFPAANNRTQSHGGPVKDVANVVKQVPVGFNEAAADAAGAPVDAVTWLLNRIPGVDIKNPVGGSESIKHGLGLVGANPDDIPATSTAQRIARGAGGGVAALIVPEAAIGSATEAGLQIAPRVAEVVDGAVGRSATGGDLAGNVAIGATSGAGSQTAEELAPEPLKPLAGAVGGLVGGVVGVGGVGAARAVPAGARAVADYAAPFTESGRENVASQTLRDRASDPRAAVEAIDAAPGEIVPGSRPTTFQVTGDMGLGSLERETAAQSPADFMQRRADQNVARTGALQSLQQDGSPADVSNFFRAQLAEIDGRQEGIETEVTRRAQSAAADMGGTRAPEQYGSDIQAELAPADAQATASARHAVQDLGGAGQPEAYGSSMRGSLGLARTAAKRHERQLWDAVDPTGTLALPSDRLRSAGATIEGNMSQSAKPIAGEEKDILDIIKNYGPNTPFREITDLRSRISTAMREELRASGETPVYGRLRRLREAVEGTISDAVEQKATADSAAVARGDMPPEQTMAAMLERLDKERSAWVAARAQNAGAGSSARSGAADAGGATAVSATRGAGREGQQRLSDVAGDSGLPEAPLQPNFSAAAQQRLRAATAATRERKQTYDSGVVGNVLRTSGMQGQFRTLDAAVPTAVFKPGPGGFEAAQAFRRAVGDDNAALGALQDYASASLRRAAERPDGTLDPERYAAWRRQHQDALRALPGLRERYDAASASAQAIDAVRPLSPNITAAHVPEQFFHPGAGGYEDVQRLRDLIGDQRARLILGDYAASRLRQTAMRPDGTLDPAKFATWRRQHQDALRAFPEMDARFADAARATEAMGEASAARKTALDTFQQGAIGKLVGVSDPQDVTRVIGGIFGQKNAVEVMKHLASETAKDTGARAGLRKATVEHINNRFISNAEGGASGAGIIKSDQFQTFIRQNAAALSTVFDESELTSLRNVAADLQRANRSNVAVKLPGGSNTAQDTAAQRVSMLRQILHHSVASMTGGGAGSIVGGPIGALTGILGGITVTAMRDAGLKKIDDLVKAALLDPNIAKPLLKAPPAKLGAGPALQLSKYMRRVAALSLYEATPQRDDTGHRNSPVNVEGPGDVHHGAERTEIPTPAQAVAGNYQKRHVKWKGLDLSIETEAGQDRAGIGNDGKPWSTAATHPYGYIRGTEGNDGDHVDVYIGPRPNAQHVFVFDQVNPSTGKFDEHKLVIGALDLNEARNIYDSGFSDGTGAQRRGAVREMSVPELKQWLASGDMSKPVAYEPVQSSRSRTKTAAYSIRPTFAQLMDDKRPIDEIRAGLAGTTAA